MRRTALKKINPFHAVDRETGLILNQNGDVTKLFRVTLPGLFTQDHNGLTHLSQELSTRFKTLPVNTLINFIGFYYKTSYESDFTQIKDFTTYHDLRHWHLKDVLEADLFIAITLSERKARPFNHGILSPLFTTKDYLFSNKPFQSIKHLDRYQATFNSFEGQMNGLDGLSLNAMGADDVLGILYKFWTFDFHEKGDSENYVVPDIEVGPKDFLVGDKNFKVVSLIKEGSDLAGGIANPGLAGGEQGTFGTMHHTRLPVSYSYPVCMGLPFDHITSISIELLDSDVVTSALDAQSIPLKLVRFLSPFARVKLDAFAEYKSLLYEEDLSAVNIGLNVILANESTQQLEDQVKHVKSAFSRMYGAVPLVETLESFPAFMYSLPGNRKDWDRNHLGILELATSYFPKEMSHQEDPEGYHFLDRTGKPVLVNFWDSALVTNVNQVIIGPSGSGKSFMANGLNHKMIAQNYQVVIIDVGHSYRETCRQINGGAGKEVNGYFDSEDRESLGINVFALNLGMGKDKEATLADKKNLIYTILKIIWKGHQELQPEESQVLKDMIGEYYELGAKGEGHGAGSMYDCSVGGFYAFVEAFDRRLEANDPIRKYIDLEAFKLVLRPFVSGDYAWVFKEQKSGIEEYPFVVFSLKGIEGDKLLYPIYTVIITELILSKIRRLPLSVRKSFIIDEAWSIFKGELKTFVEYLYRTIRKENGQVTVITQNANDLASSGILDAIKINTDIKILLQHKNLDESSQRVLRDVLGLTSRDLQLLESLGYSERGREFFVKFGSEPFVFINENSPESNLLYTTDPKEMAALRELTEKTGSTEAAIHEYVALKKTNPNQSL